MLKHRLGGVPKQTYMAQPPSGGCVLKQEDVIRLQKQYGCQPPSGGCVLKQELQSQVAALTAQPPSGGCVLKLLGLSFESFAGASRLRAAVC